jgi:hypothetical protein
MANVHALMKGDYDRIPASAGSYYWLINFNCMTLNSSGEFYDVPVKVLVNTTDNAATVSSKVIDAIVAAIAARSDGNVLPRTNVHLTDFIRGT